MTNVIYDYAWALFFLDSNNEADGRVDHYCSNKCCNKDSSRLIKEGRKFDKGKCSDWIEGSQCTFCGIDLDEHLDVTTSQVNTSHDS